MAKIDYFPGDLIQSNCQPFYKIRKNLTSKGKICDECFAPACGSGSESCALTPCENCQLMFYCSAVCKVKDWRNGHAIECGSSTFRNNFRLDSDSELRIHIFRAMAFLSMNPELANKQCELYSGATRCFNDLLSHVDTFQKSPVKLVCSNLAEDILNEKLQTVNFVPDANSLLKLAGIFQTNGFTIYNEAETEEIGSGIYIEPSIFNHSCKPTAIYCSTGTRIDVRAISPIRQGKEPCISYISDHIGTQERKSLLLERYNFECHCERCESDLDEEIDYKKLNELIDLVSTSPGSTMQRLMAIHRALIQTMGTIYHEYDSRISNQYVRTVFALISRKVSFRMPAVQELVADTRKHLQISCGLNHAEYRKFEKAISIQI